MSCTLPVAVQHRGRELVPRTHPGPSAGWTVLSFRTEGERDAFMRNHPLAAMPAWKRIAPRPRV